MQHLHSIILENGLTAHGERFLYTLALFSLSPHGLCYCIDFGAAYGHFEMFMLHDFIIESKWEKLRAELLLLWNPGNPFHQNQMQFEL